jgi:hypothetical protein
MKISKSRVLSVVWVFPENLLTLMVGDHDAPK